MTAVQHDTRFPASVYQTGTEPDPAASLANRAVLLSWVRTGAVLAVGAGVAVTVGTHATLLLRGVAAGLLLVAGLYSLLQAWTGWVAAERAIRRGRPLPGMRPAFLVVALVLIAVILLAVAVVPALLT